MPVLAVVNALYADNSRLLCGLDGTHTTGTWRGMESFECWKGMKNKALTVLGMVQSNALHIYKAPQFDLSSSDGDVCTQCGRLWQFRRWVI